jgi:hypothetical protein
MRRKYSCRGQARAGRMLVWGAGQGGQDAGWIVATAPVNERVPQPRAVVPATLSAHPHLEAPPLQQPQVVEVPPFLVPQDCECGDALEGSANAWACSIQRPAVQPSSGFAGCGSRAPRDRGRARNKAPLGAEGPGSCRHGLPRWPQLNSSPARAPSNAPTISWKRCLACSSPKCRSGWERCEEGGTGPLVSPECPQQCPSRAAVLPSLALGRVAAARPPPRFAWVSRRGA